MHEKTKAVSDLLVELKCSLEGQNVTPETLELVERLKKGFITHMLGYLEISDQHIEGAEIIERLQLEIDALKQQK